MEHPLYTILHGDALTVLRTLPDASVHCCVTSPPYWGLRDYGTATWEGGDAECEHVVGGQVRDHKAPEAITTGQRPGVDATTCRKCGARRIDSQLGLERTPAEYVAHMVEVFSEVKRVLRDDGTLWLNIGDSYASGKGTCHNPGGGPKSYIQEKERFPLDRGSISSLRDNGLKPKDLCGIPWRLAFALQDDGWWLRAEIIWAKRAPMPESVTDRPTRSHEQIFLLAKSARYYYDAEAVKEDSIHAGKVVTLGEKSLSRGTQTAQGLDHWCNGTADSITVASGRNQRDVWLLGPEPYPEAHFATFPTEIPRRAILAGTSERGVCPNCGAPWKRMIVHTDHPDASAKGSRFDIGKTADRDGGDRTQAGERMTKQTIGWLPGCTCACEPVPATVLDPFLGSGTTLAVAVGLGRRGIGIELNASYIELAEQRITAVQPPLIRAFP